MIAGFSERIRKLRKDRHLNQGQIAELLGVTKSSISMYENDMRQPSLETLVRLARVFNVTTDFLLGCTDERSLDLSGLTSKETAVVTELVSCLATQNRKLEELRK